MVAVLVVFASVSARAQSKADEDVKRTKVPFEDDSEPDRKQRGIAVDRATKRVLGAWEVPGVGDRKRVEFFNPGGTITTSFLDAKGKMQRSVDLGTYTMKSADDGIVLSIAIKPAVDKAPVITNEFIVEFHGTEKMVLRLFAATDDQGKRVTIHDDPKQFTQQPLVFRRFEVGSKVAFNTGPAVRHKRSVINLRKLGALYGEKTATVLFVRASDDAMAKARPHFKDLYLLRSMNLARSKITDKALAHMKELGLEELDLSDTVVSDQGMQFLASMTNLRRLSLARTKVTDEGLAHLKSLVKLEEFDLSSTDVSDVGLKYLKGFKKLRILRARGTKATADGAEVLSELVPELSLVVLGPPIDE